MAASLPGVSLFVGLCADPDRLSLAQVLCSRIFPVQTLELTEKGTVAASVFLRVVQRIVRVLVDAVAGIGAIGERGACAQRYLRHAIDGLR